MWKLDDLDLFKQFGAIKQSFSFEGFTILAKSELNFCKMMAKTLQAPLAR